MILESGSQKQLSLLDNYVNEYDIVQGKTSSRYIRSFIALLLTLLQDQ